MSRRTPDLTGKRFGRLTVKSQAVEILNGKKQSVCTCICDCGREVKVAVYHLQKKDGTEPKMPTRSCGCTKTIGDLTGKRFGRLLVLNEEKKNRDGRQWKCQCDCGNVIITSASGLNLGFVKSCGCGLKEAQARLASYTKLGAKASHAPEVEKRRLRTAYSTPEERKAVGERLYEDRKKAGVLVDHANIDVIVAEEPKAQNPYRGVCYNKRKKSWMAYCQVNGIKWAKSGFKTPEEAKEVRDEKQEELIRITNLEDAVERRKKES